MSDDLQRFPDRVRTILAHRRRVIVDDPALICAAVLLPLLYEAGQWHVLVTQRTQMVEHHKGQISFPGGACEPADGDLQATALRETFEEIGVPPQAVEILGVLDDMPSVTNFVVTPFVGVIPPALTYRLNDGEVEAVVSVPLAFLLDPAHLRTEQWQHQGRAHEVLFWDYGPYTIWGLTARILKSFLDLIF